MKNTAKEHFTDAQMLSVFGVAGIHSDDAKELTRIISTMPFRTLHEVSDCIRLFSKGRTSK